MGSHCQFRCTSCGYGATISGGLDSGFRVTVRTMVCPDCRELVDVLVGAYGKEGGTGDPEFDKGLNRCPECSGRKVTVWPERKPCPKCGERMLNQGLVVMWD